MVQKEAGATGGRNPVNRTQKRPKWCHLKRAAQVRFLGCLGLRALELVSGRSRT